MPILNRIVRRRARRIYNKNNARFVWNIGSIDEVYPDMAGVNGTVLWDRQESKPVITLHAGYANAFCLETTKLGCYPFTLCEQWFNSASNKALESEGITPTK